MRLLVITPTLNRSKFLDETICSVQACAPDAEHILSAPASEIKSLRQQYPTLKVVADHGREGGMYGAINAGIEAAESEWVHVAYVNDDDILTDQFSNMLQSAALNSADLIYGGVQYIDHNGKSLSPAPLCPSPKLIRHLLYDGIVPFMQVGMIFSRKIYETLSGFDSNSYRFTGDLDFICRAVNAHARCFIHRKQVAKFRLLPDQLSANGTAMQQEHDQTISRFRENCDSGKTHRKIAQIIYYISNLNVYLLRIIRFRKLSNQSMAESVRS
ncbi:MULTISPECIES: glycosyltransferase [unclassified Lentimonas]|uniref:glycosyltransferase n=1 Tax=unclassified Lentimonas TaxID=2630993 RepID=UPI0013241ECC|nr:MULTISPECIES: glycosyltransferase [unclassified Lentimonas]CAA6696215.1 Unannotated [Lentimonas sp. CC10]CAA6697527.1 Unannotated [Lentimonas sp. CC19]CAA7071247.1 Unannotated [Lentimonas sp. CC11]